MVFSVPRWQKTKRSDPLSSALQGSAIHPFTACKGFLTTVLGLSSYVRNSLHNTLQIHFQYHMTSMESIFSVYEAPDFAKSRPGTVSPEGSICSGSTGVSVGDGCGTGDDSSDTGSYQSRFSSTRKHRVQKTKTMIDRRVGEPNKRTEDRNTAHQGMEGYRRNHTGSRPGTMSPGNSIRSCATGRSLSGYCDTRSDDSDTSSIQSRFAALYS